MLCIFLGPTKSPDPTQYVAPPQWPQLEKAIAGVALMERGGKFVRDIAGEVQVVTVNAVGPCEHRPTVGYFPDGLHHRDIVAVENPRERYQRRLKELGQEHFAKMLPFKADTDPFAEEPLAVKTLGPLTITSYAEDQVWISPKIDDALGRKLDFNDLPEGFTWGNGVTCNSWVKLKTGEAILLSWCVLADDTAAAVKADKSRWRTLCDLMEG